MSLRVHIYKGNKSFFFFKDSLVEPNLMKTLLIKIVKIFLSRIRGHVGMIQVLYSIWLIKISREEEFTRELLEVKRRDTWRSLCNPKEIPVRLYIGIEFSAGSNDEATFSPRTIKGAQSVFKEQLRRVLSSVVETHVLRPDNSIEYRGNKPVQLHIFILNGQHVE